MCETLNVKGEAAASLAVTATVDGGWRTRESHNHGCQHTNQHSNTNCYQYHGRDVLRSAKVYCPACDQDGCVAVSASSSASSAAGGGGVCDVRCTAATNGQWYTCAHMKVFSGPGGAEVACQESGGTSASALNCKDLQLHQPSDAAAAATAPVEFDCASCSSSCCFQAKVTPGTRPVTLPRAREKNTHARASLPC